MTFRQRFAIPAVVALLVMGLLAACGGGDDPGEAPVTTQAPADDMSDDDMSEDMDDDMSDDDMSGDMDDGMSDDDMGDDMSGDDMTDTTSG